jgi:hypothetical protein
LHFFGATSQFKGVHDKIGHVAKFMVAMLERYGDVEARAYTAYMFYEVLLKHLKTPNKLKDQNIMTKLKKPHTATTRYINLYAASDVTDAEDKDVAKVNMILDRSVM